MSDVSEHSDSEFYFPKKKKKKEKRGGHMIKCLLTELGRAGRENIWPSVISHGPRCARSVRHDLLFYIKVFLKVLFYSPKYGLYSYRILQ